MSIQACTAHTDGEADVSTVMTLLSESATARANSSLHAWQKKPPSLRFIPPIAVSWWTAGFPHHSQRRPSGAQSTEIGRRNAWSNMRILLFSTDRGISMSLSNLFQNANMQYRSRSFSFLPDTRISHRHHNLLTGAQLDLHKGVTVRSRKKLIISRRTQQEDGKRL